MLNNPYFFILLSFIIFLYVGYKKIWPDIFNKLRDDIEKIKNEFASLETKKTNLQNDLDFLISSKDSFKDELQEIHNISLEHAEKIKDVYVRDMELLSKRQASRIDKIYLRLIQRFENDSLHYFSKEFSSDLSSFFKQQMANKNFHKDVLQKSLLLLQKTS